MATSSNSGPEVPGPTGGYRNAPVSAPGFDDEVPTLTGGAAPALSGSLVVDLAALDAAAALAGETAGRADGMNKLLQAAVSRSGPAPWGDDPGLGQSFGSAFTGPRDSLLEAVELVPQILRDMAEKLRATSHSLAEAEEAAVEMALAAGRGMPRELL